MRRPAIEVADIVRAKGRQYLEHYQSSVSYQQLKAYRAVERCRTAALGGHKDKCVNCPYEAPHSYNSCRSRCCPKCQAQERRRWLQAQQRDLLNTNYFHVVFTVPHELNPLALTSPRPFLDLLFDASSQALLEVARDPKWLGAEIGFLSILHTWSQTLLGHYHVHCVVPGGGLSPDHQRWISTSHPRFLLPIAVLHNVFRVKFLAGLRHLYRKNVLDCRAAAADFHDPAWFEQLIEELRKTDWYVYAKPPFGGPEHVLGYLGRYTHRMAISNHRITAFDGEEVSFRWRDYRHGGIQRVMPLEAVEFLRRFFLHVLPRGFVRIRHYGLLANRFRKQLLPLARTLLADQGREPLPLPAPPDSDLWHCPRCGSPMRVVERFTAAELYFAGLDSS
ncbi:MAG: IS91 family transposase [Candidatus Korobacteraceae bacterium]|jgi:putative transposase/transposase-like zinc-binding protein